MPKCCENCPYYCKSMDYCIDPSAREMCPNYYDYYDHKHGIK